MSTIEHQNNQSNKSNQNSPVAGTPVTGTRLTGTVLDQIVATKPQQIIDLKQKYPEAEILAQLQPSQRSLFDALREGPACFILECKKASPSKGLIREDFDLPLITDGYRHHASAISVLTDEQYFQGNFEYVKQVRALLDQPIICKDFFVDAYQIYLARYMGADAILLMLSVLDDQQYQALAEVAAQFSMDVLTEVSNQQELDRAIALEAKIIGINNRDLRDLSINLNTTKILAPKIPSDRVIISESGINDHQQILALAPFVDGFLVGSSLMAQDDIDLACRQLIYGNTKICGLTNPEQAQAAAASGAVYGGVIFATKSPRCVELAQAQSIRDSANLNFIGVFVNEEIDVVVQYASQLKLSVIQLHGNEAPTYIAQLRQQLNSTCQIWLAVRCDQLSDLVADDNVDRLLIDSAVTNAHSTQFGGTGQTFDWEQVPHSIRAKAMLAGGLSPDNIKTAANSGYYGLDVNSGVESSPGVKDLVKIKKLMLQIRNY
jgi:indole-3-glycerol phosphate synthase/phosphoribosylanthranilate isomerase